MGMAPWLGSAFRRDVGRHLEQVTLRVDDQLGAVVSQHPQKHFLGNIIYVRRRDCPDVLPGAMARATPGTTEPNETQP
jgi:hypothetical protein